MLLPVAIVLGIVCYFFSVSKTIEQYRLTKQYKSVEQTGNEEYVIENLKQKAQFLDEMLGRFLIDTVDKSKNLLVNIAPLCEVNDLILKEYKPFSSVTQKDSVSLLTRSVIIEGKFIDCIKLVHNLETQSKIGRVSSLMFKSFTNPGETKTNLNCTIYIQNIIPSKNER